jgi:cytochrome c nitrite reductase small subunit
VLSAAALWKLLAFAGFAVVPAATVAVANYHTFEGVHHVEACARCHVMRPMVTDMHDPHSDNLAARHYRNHWIPQDQCFHCHSDYGLAGDLEAKMTGFRHLARYTTRTYHEPIAGRTGFNNQNCYKCHEGAPRFEAVASHRAVGELLRGSAMSCLNCHGKAHPTRAQRTPGSADYERLMEAAR